MIHTVKGFGIVNKAEVDVFWKLSCSFDDPVHVGNLISGSSAFSKSGLNIWKFMVHILLNPCLGNYEPYFASVWRGQWHPTPVLLPGKSHGWRSLVGCSPWGRWGSDTPERLHFHFSLSCIGEGNSNPLQCSCLENPRDGGAWWAAVYGVTQSRTWLKRLSSSSMILSHCCDQGKLGMAGPRVRTEREISKTSRVPNLRRHSLLGLCKCETNSVVFWMEFLASSPLQLITLADLRT